MILRYSKYNESIDFNDIDIDETHNRHSPLTDDEFVKFLIDHDIYDKFISNLESPNNTDEFRGGYWNSIETFCDDISTEYGRGDYIDRSFDWEYSPEGHSFWESYSDAWIDYIR